MKITNQSRCRSARFRNAQRFNDREPVTVSPWASRRSRRQGMTTIEMLLVLASLVFAFAILTKFAMAVMVAYFVEGSQLVGVPLF